MRNPDEDSSQIYESVDRDGSQAIGRAAALLREIATAPGQGMRLYQLAERLGMSRPTTHRILRRLVTEGLVEQEPRSRGYRLGRLIYELGLKVAIPADWRQIGGEALARVAQVCEDTAFLYARSGHDSVCLERREGDYPVRVLVMDPGQRRPMGTGAASLAMLALLQDEDVRRILQENRLRLDAMGEVSNTELLHYVAQGRELGYVIKPTVRFPEVSSMAVAVRNSYGEPVLTLSVSSLAPRLASRAAQLLPLLQKEAALLSRRLGELPRV